jgi:uncharacterized membrane protein HdeD (DUF308 family)
MTSNIADNVKDEHKSPLWIGIVLIVLGAIGIALPNISTIIVETWISLLLVSAGGAKLVYAFQTRDRGGFVWKLLLSILYIATGVGLFVYPLSGVVSLTLLLGSFLLTEGTFELILAFRLRPQENWTWVLGNAITTLLLGGIVWFEWPSNAPWLIGTVVGASVIVTGISRVMMSLKPGSSSNLDQGDRAASA